MLYDLKMQNISAVIKKLFILMVLTIAVLCDDGDGNDTSLITVTTSTLVSATMKEVDVLEGDPVVVNCTLKRVYPDVNSSQMFFKFQDHIVEEKYISRPNALTVQLNITATINNSGHLFCHARNKPETLAHELFMVHKRPIPPTDLQCMVEDWSKMVCSWKPTAEEQSNHTGLPTEQKLYWTLLYENDTELIPNVCVMRPMPNTTLPSCNKEYVKSHRTFCEQSIRTGVYLYAVLKSHFNFHNSIECETISTVLKINLSVKPAKVWNIQAVNVTKSSFVLQWKISKSIDRDTDLWYNITLKTKYGDVIQKDANPPTKGKDMISNTCDGLTPYTTYDISISCIPHFLGVRKGYWSDAATFTVQTLPGIAGAAPAIEPGGFEIEASTSKITIYFQPIPPKDRHGVLNKIRVTIIAIGKNENHDGSNIILFNAINTNNIPITSVIITKDLEPELDYLLSLDASTKVGFNEKQKTSSILIINKTARLPLPENFVIRYNTTTNVILASWSAVDKAEGYTVYWCDGNTKHGCNNKAMKFAKYLGNSSSVVVPFDAPFSSVGGYTFALSAEGAESSLGIPSSGLTFSTCSYNAEHSISLPINFRYDDDVNQRPDSLKLVWKNPNCAGSDYIQHYVIEYKKSNSPENWKTVIVPGEKESALVEDLQGGTTYRIRVSSRSPWKTSAKTKLLDAKVVSRTGLSTAGQIGLAIGVLVFIILILLGLLSALRCCKTFYKKRRERLTIILPEESGKKIKASHLEDEDEESNLLDTGAMHSDVDNSDVVQHNYPFEAKHDKYFQMLPLVNGHASHVQNGHNPVSNGCADVSAVGSSLNNYQHDHIYKSGTELYAAGDLAGGVAINSYDGASGAAQMNDENGGAENPHDHLHEFLNKAPVIHSPERAKFPHANQTVYKSDDLTSGSSSITAYSKMTVPANRNHSNERNDSCLPSNVCESNCTNSLVVRDNFHPLSSEKEDVKANERHMETDNKNMLPFVEDSNISETDDHKETSVTESHSPSSKSVPFIVNTGGYVFSLPDECCDDNKEDLSSTPTKEITTNELAIEENDFINSFNCESDPKDSDSSNVSNPSLNYLISQGCANKPNKTTIPMENSSSSDKTSDLNTPDATSTMSSNFNCSNDNTVNKVSPSYTFVEAESAKLNNNNETNCPGIEEHSQLSQQPDSPQVVVSKLQHAKSRENTGYVSPDQLPSIV